MWFVILCSCQEEKKYASDLFECCHSFKDRSLQTLQKLQH